MKLLANKTLLLTGGSRGIDRAITLTAAKAGAKVALTYNQHRLEAENVVALIQENGGEAIAVELKLENNTSIAPCFKNKFRFI